MSVRSIRSNSINSTTSSTNRHRSLSTSSESNESINVGVENDDDENVRIAIAALGIMRSGSIGAGPSLTSASTSTSSTFSHHHPSSTLSNSLSQLNTTSRTPSTWSGPPTTTTCSTGASSPVGPASFTSGTSERGDLVQVVDDDPHFIARVSQLPLVSGGLEWYERSKASSRVVKYGAGLVESSLSTISRPLTKRVALNQLDDFACRQLDRLGGPTVSHSASSHEMDEMEEDARSHARREIHVGASKFVKDDDAAAAARGKEAAAVTTPTAEDQQMQQTVAVVSRSRWQTVLVEAGGLGAAVSDESLKSLRYCLQWLIYATAHLDHQITILRDFIASLQRHHPTDSRSDALITASASAHLSQIKHDVVETIRKVVEVVSKYAGAALPEQAKKYVRQSILSLPVKWASAIEGNNRTRARSVSVAMSDTTMGNGENGSAGSSRNTSVPMSAAGSNSVGNGITNAVLRPTEEAAERVLTFAVESLDMLKSVTSIFGDSVEKAEAWIERLRIVGIDRIRERQAAAQQSAAFGPAPPDEYSSASGAKRRRNDLTTTSSSSASAVDGSEEVNEDNGLRRKRNGRRAESVEMHL